MGRKLSHESSLKICKHIEKRSFNSTMMSALRPRVYITDSSSFKQLVQELTGKRNPIKLNEEFPVRSCRECEGMIKAGSSADPSDGSNMEQFNQQTYQMPLNGDQALEFLASDRRANDFAYRDLESWFLETGKDQFDHSCDHLSSGASVGATMKDEQCELE